MFELNWTYCLWLDWIRSILIGLLPNLKEFQVWKNSSMPNNKYHHPHFCIKKRKSPSSLRLLTISSIFLFFFYYHMPDLIKKLWSVEVEESFYMKPLLHHLIHRRNKFFMWEKLSAKSWHPLGLLDTSSSPIYMGCLLWDKGWELVKN